MTIYDKGPTVGVTATVAAAGTTTLAGTWPYGLIGQTENDFPDNCHTVIIYNSDGTNSVLVGVNLALPALGAGNPVTNGIRIAAEETLTLSIGTLSNRVSQVAGSGAVSGFVYDVTAGTNIRVDITYVCGPTT